MARKRERERTTVGDTVACDKNKNSLVFIRFLLVVKLLSTAVEMVLQLNPIDFWIPIDGHVKCIRKKKVKDIHIPHSPPLNPYTFGTYSVHVERQVARMVGTVPVQRSWNWVALGIFNELWQQKQSYVEFELACVVCLLLPMAWAMENLQLTRYNSRNGKKTRAMSTGRRKKLLLCVGACLCAFTVSAIDRNGL